MARFWLDRPSAVPATSHFPFGKDWSACVCFFWRRVKLDVIMIFSLDFVFGLQEKRRSYPYQNSEYG